MGFRSCEFDEDTIVAVFGEKNERLAIDPVKLYDDNIKTLIAL